MAISKLFIVGVMIFCIDVYGQELDHFRGLGNPVEDPCRREVSHCEPLQSSTCLGTTLSYKYVFIDLLYVATYIYILISSACHAYIWTYLGRHTTHFCFFVTEK